MSIGYRENKFISKTVIPKTIFLEDDSQFTYDVWTGYVDRYKKEIFENDIVEYDGEQYAVRWISNGYILFPYSKRLQWYDEIDFIDRVANRCIVVGSIWEKVAKNETNKTYGAENNQ